jgi:glycosyltransferase involved in cell wall biosynthesis
MRVVMLVDRGVHARERDMLARLEIGLADEGVRVCHAAPQSTLHSEAESGSTAGIYSEMVGYADGGLLDGGIGGLLTRGSRVRALANELMERLEGDSPRCIDLIHCFVSPGSSQRVPWTWRLAIDLARLTHARVLLEISGAPLIGAATSLVSHHVAVDVDPAGTDGGSLVRQPVQFCAPGEAIRSALLKRAPRAGVHVVPWGVHPDREAANDHARLALHSITGTSASPRGTVGIALLGGGDAGVYSRHVAPALEAIAGLPAGGGAAPEVIVVCSAAPRVERVISAHVRRLKIGDRLTLVPDIEARREPALKADVLVCTEAAGVRHTLMLDGMARGVAVVAGADPLVDELIDGVTARVVDRPTVEAWSMALRGVLDGNARASLGASASRWIASNRTASTQVRGLLGLYERMMTGTSVVV